MKRSLSLLSYVATIICSISIIGCQNSPADPTPVPDPQPTTSEYIIVTEHGIANDGSPIGHELNELVCQSYGKTLYFPAGSYNITEPIELPFDYTKNVNLILDHNATIRTYSKIPALLKIGYTETSTPDTGRRLFSFVEGGTFDAEYAKDGICINGLKQLVSLRTLNVIHCRGKHINISVTNDSGTGSSDTKIDNVTIMGFSSNENSYGIYIDGRCCDCKISDTFIYGTKCALYTKSAGHIVNNVHILSWVISGGDSGDFVNTEGIRLDSGGFFTFNEIYFDTTDKNFVINGVNPDIILDKSESYSWKEGVGHSFISSTNSYTREFNLKFTGANIDLGHVSQNYKMFDIDYKIIPLDVEKKITFDNNNIMSPDKLYRYDPCLMMKLRGTKSESLLKAPKMLESGKWYCLGALAISNSTNDICVKFTDDLMANLKIKFTPEGGMTVLEKELICEEGTKPVEIAYSINEHCCTLFFKLSSQYFMYPEIIDKAGNSSYLCVPDKSRTYEPKDYGVTTEPIIIL